MVARPMEMSFNLGLWGGAERIGIYGGVLQKGKRGSAIFNEGQCEKIRKGMEVQEEARFR